MGERKSACKKLTLLIYRYIWPIFRIRTCTSISYILYCDPGMAMVGSAHRNHTAPSDRCQAFPGDTVPSNFPERGQCYDRWHVFVGKVYADPEFFIPEAVLGTSYLPCVSCFYFHSNHIDLLGLLSRIFSFYFNVV